MPKDFPRARRVAEQIQRELSQLLLAEVKDPRLRLVTVTEVEVTRDLAHAKVFVSVLGSDDASEAVAGLRHAAGHLRRLLARDMRMRSVPELHFSEDRVLIEGSRLSALINRAMADDARHHHDEPESASGEPDPE
jgi:ribosome-binding factor A